MANFRVTHLPLRQPNKHTRCIDQGFGLVLPEFVPERGAGIADGIVEGTALGITDSITVGIAGAIAVGTVDGIATSRYTRKGN